MSWTQKQLQKELRKAGWRNDGQGVYMHEEGGKFYSWQWHPGIKAHFETGELWRLFAAAEALPHPIYCSLERPICEGEL